jgi:hypothetical protein
VRVKRKALTVRASLVRAQLNRGALLVRAHCNRSCRMTARLVVRGAPRGRSRLIRKRDRGKGVLFRVSLPQRVYTMATRRTVRVVVLVTARSNGRRATARQPVKIKSG